MSQPIKKYEIPYEKMVTPNAGIFGVRFPQQKTSQTTYDPLAEYYNTHGIRDFNSITRFTNHYINIDSRLRKKESTFNSSEHYSLVNDPLIMTHDTNTIKIKIANIDQTFMSGEKIILFGMSNVSKKLRVSSGFFEFTNGSEYVKINYPTQLLFADYDEVKKYKSNDLQIELANIPNIFINNIPVNTLNTVHRIYLFNPENNDFSNDYFFVKLIRSFEGTYTHTTDYNIKLIYLYSYGIPNNKICSRTSDEFLVIKNVDAKYIHVETAKTISINGNSIKLLGGNNMSIAKITQIEKGYLFPTNYNVELDRIYNNVVSLKILSSEFPTVDRLIYDLGDAINNKFYWQNLDDGDVLYNVAIPHGNYSLEKIIELLQIEIKKVSRFSNDIGNYNNKNIIDILSNDNEIFFNSFKEAELQAALTFSLVSTGVYDMTIVHSSHHLKVGDKIIISEAIDSDTIKASDVNKEHMIYAINNANEYVVRIYNINNNGSVTVTGGGNSIKILAENIFRMRYDFNDTIGNIFGFHKLGDSKSVTSYVTSISNRDPYYNEQINTDTMYSDLNGNYKIKSIDLNNEKYVQMTLNTPNVKNETINQMISYSKIKNIFGKIQTYKSNNKFVQTQNYIHNPIQTFKEFEVSFYDKYGNLLEYYDFEHSFTLEIITINEISEGTNISSKYMKIN